MNENENTAYKNLWDEAEAVLREKFTAIKAYTRKKEKDLK